MKTTKGMLRIPPRTRFAAAIFGLGLVWFCASWIGGDTRSAVTSLAWILLVGAGYLLAARRSETLAGLIDRNDERLTGIDLRATAFAGAVTMTTIILIVAYQTATGTADTLLSALGTLAAVAYIGAVAWLRARS